MYKTISILFAIISFSYNSLAQSPDDIIGIWTNSSKTETIEIYKVTSKFEAKITNSKNKKWIGKTVIWDLNYDSKEKEWNSGFIQKPDMSHSVSCYISLKAKAHIIISGYHGWRMFGSSETWTKN